MGFNNRRNGMITIIHRKTKLSKRLNLGAEKWLYTYKPKDISPSKATAGAKDDDNASRLLFTFLMYHVQNAVYETIPTIKMAHNAPK